VPPPTAPPCRPATTRSTAPRRRGSPIPLRPFRIHRLGNRAIIDAAADLFGEVGYGDTGMIDVIELAATTKGTCYYYFPTIEFDLFNQGVVQRVLKPR
jgi:AcrR family transcriptional regulator